MAKKKFYRFEVKMSVKNKKDVATILDKIVTLIDTENQKTGRGFINTDSKFPGAYSFHLIKEDVWNQK